MLKTEHALGVGLATAGVVYGVFSISVPTVSAVRAAKPGNIHVDSSRKGATITAGSLVALIGLISRDPTVFIIGGLAVIALDMTHRAANATDHISGKIPGPGAGVAASGSITVSGA